MICFRKKFRNSVCHLCLILVANLTLQNFHFAFILICKMGWNFAVFSALPYHPNSKSKQKFNNAFLWFVLPTNLWMFAI